MQTKIVYDAEEFELSLKAYLSYISRKMKKDESYSPHPLVRAMVNAVDGAKNTGKPGRYMGMSGDANQYSDNQERKTIICIIEMHRDNTMTILDIQDLSLQKSIPIKVASYIFLLSIKFDKYEGDYIGVNEFIDTVNRTIPQLNIIRFKNDEWKEARDYLVKNLNTINIPLEMKKDYEKDFMSIKGDTEWEDYPPRVRSTIATIWMDDKYQELYRDGVMNIVNVFLDEKYLKTTMLNSILMILYGPSSKYFEDVLEWNLFTDLNMNNTISKTSTKIGRNQPCPCDSGKKFKKCCGSLIK
ncbi:YecA family protein [Paenibacillus fonticola]|uniref:YecA family protein n=1 Tax=Paenibacillus fonticola TaxID=379896 RepID=UPI000368A5CA|nr:SEC-C metal-binding domain-containing protein [Paenibacillus fonticola]